MIGAPATTRPGRSVWLASIAIGLLWNLLPVRPMGGTTREATAPVWVVASAITGALAGGFTVWSRARRGGREHVVDVIATYSLGIVAYWACFVAIARIVLGVRQGGWTDCDLRDHRVLIVPLLTHGTLWYGLVVVPLTFVSRHVVWRVHTLDARKRMEEP